MNKIIFILMLVLSLVACGVDENPQTQHVVTGPSSDQQIDAIMRGYPNAKKVCIDGSRENTFYLYYGPPLAAGATVDNQYHGWLLLSKVPFYSAPNNTYFIAIEGDEEKRIVQVFPDVTGLTCKEQP